MALALAARPHEIRALRLGAGRTLRVRSWPGRGEPLVLLHGLLDDAEGWAQLARDTHRPALAVDLPGFGGSDLPSRPRISAYAEAVVEGLEQLELPGVTLVGHSLGGAVATAVAERCPAVRALVLLAPAGYGKLRLAEAMTLPGVRQAAELAMPVALVNPLTVTAAYATFVAHHRLPSRDLMGRIVRRSFRSGPGVSAAVQAIAAAGRSERAFAARTIDFAGPVAALWGEHDALVPREHIAALERALPQAHVEVWDGMGHHPQRERPQQLAEYIERHAARAPRLERAAPRTALRAA
jgi:pyruvate dehydrogenase E2 component (dihydrolipoamide acetyltransferase)